MYYISVQFYIFLVLVLIVYYSVKPTYRWKILLVANILFYIEIAKEKFIVLIGMAFLSWILASLGKNYIAVSENKILHRFFYGVVIILILTPLWISKNNEFICTAIGISPINWIAPIGFSFYLLQNYSYVIDVYKGKIKQENNFLKYLTFISFFPQVIQGPIAPYRQIEKQLFNLKEFNENNIKIGFQKILIGFFVKMMIADKLAIIVNTLFNNYIYYHGFYVVFAGFLYGLQLYTDFLSCVTICQGIGKLFGIDIMDNFNHPYNATSVRDFWKRWHISLSNWLFEYVYVPLGGSKKGNIRKWINILVVFLISGMWHGAGFKYIIWGGMHAVFMMIGDMTLKLRTSLYDKMGLMESSKIRRFIEKFITVILVSYTWIIFRAEKLRIGIKMIMASFSNFIYYAKIDENGILGLDEKDLIVLVICTFIFIIYSHFSSKILTEKCLLQQNSLLRFSVYFIVIFSIVIFGTYGIGYDAKDFIYGGF